MTLPHLDPRSEYELFQLMRHLKADNTVIFITHNIRNVTDADQIIWFEDGRVLEKGSHAELMALEGKYYRAYCSRYNTLL